MQPHRRSARLLLLATVAASACTEPTLPTAVPDGLTPALAAGGQNDKVKVKTMQLSANTLRINGPSVSGTVAIGNSGLAIPTSVVLRGELTQGAASRQAVNTAMQCSPAPADAGKLPTGTCEMTFVASASNSATGTGTLSPGAATFTLRVIHTSATGGTELASKTLLVNLVVTPSLTVTLAPTTVRIDGPAATATAVMQNPANSLQGVLLQSWIVQGAPPNQVRRPTGGTLVTCGSNAGVLPPGTCTMTMSIAATNSGNVVGTLTSGPATFEMEFAQSSGSSKTVLETKTVPINLIWGVPRITRLVVAPTTLQIGGDNAVATVDIQNDGDPRSNVILYASMLQIFPSGTNGEFAGSAPVTCGGGAPGVLPTTGTGVCTVQFPVHASDDGADGQLISGAAELLVDLMDASGVIERQRTPVTLVEKQARIASVIISPAVQIGGVPTAFKALIGNSGGTLSNLMLQNWISQGTARRAAAGTPVQCNGGPIGELPAGSCLVSSEVKAMNAPHAGTGTLVPGPATLELYLTQQVNGVTTTLDTAFVPVDLYVVAPGIIGIELSALNVLIGESLTYTATLYNPTSETISAAGIQGFLSQGSIVDFGTGGTTLTCAGVAEGQLAPGLCTVSFTLGTRTVFDAPAWSLGAATFRLELTTGSTLLDKKSLTIFLNGLQ